MTQIQLTRDVYVNVQFKDLGNLDDLNATMQFGPQCTGRLSSQLDTTSEILLSPESRKDNLRPGYSSGTKCTRKDTD